MLQIADMDRALYADHALTLALHPSETEERLMVRLLAFVLQVPADDHGGALQFARGLSDADAPDLWLHDLTGQLQHWVEVGLPDDKWVKKACGRADRVVVLAYGGHRAQVWWNQQQAALERFENLSVVAIDPEATVALGRLAARSMKLSCTVQDGQVWIGGVADGDGVNLTPAWWRGTRLDEGG
jgi:uncharacterized protein YaeQ